MKQKVLVAMSGGVDSSTAAFLLQKEGYEVVGVTLRLWHANDDRKRPGGCCSLEDIHDARRVCHHLGIKHYVLNFEKDFKESVVKDFVSEYLSGRTPNPCIVCNDILKFGLLLKKARALGFDYLATGHYARIDRANGLSLRKGVDERKDQSYVLYRLTEKDLARLLLPLGDYTKKEIRRIAAEAGLPAADKPESQEICFIDTDYASFLKNYLKGRGKTIKPGPIIDTSGKLLGRHRGLPYYTFGQRSGLGLTTPLPVYVVDIDVKKNTLVVGGKEETVSEKAFVDKLTWVSGTAPRFPVSCAVKIRRLHQEAPAVLAMSGKKLFAKFDTPQPAVTPGQAAVFYREDTVLGGGIISR